MVRAPVLAALLLAASITSAQDYGFSVPEFSCTVRILPDQSLDISYEILFRCNPGAHPVDIVDIGFPSEDYDISSVSASVDGMQVYRIAQSTYIDVGVEAHLGTGTIYPGESGLFRLRGRNPRMVFRDTETEGWASVRFSPTWFEGGFLTGTSDFTLTVVFPEGSLPDSVRYHEREFSDAGVDSLGRVWYTWQERRKVDGPWTVGVSFPGHLVAGPLGDRPKAPLITGEQVGKLLCWAAPVLFVVFFTWAVVSAVKRANRRKVAYLPPRIGVEGSGIRRGLTAPMAAMLLEERLERVLVLILYGLLRKGALELDGRGHRNVLRKTGAGGRLRDYEVSLLSVLPEPGTGEKVSGDDLRKVFVDMVEDLEEKMEGYSLQETRKYYRHIIANAWEMVSRADSAEKAGRILADRFAWLFADREFGEKVDTLPEFTTTSFPAWFPGGSWAGGFTSGGGPSLAQFCAGIAGTLEGAAGSVVSTLSSLSASVTSITNPVPVASSSSYSGGGGGCACACACAGCACACAGGGR